jgi:hypothetical protein
MNLYRFEGTSQALMWTLLRTIGVLIAVVLLASMISGWVSNGFVQFILASVVAITNILAWPSIVNSMIKYLVEQTQLQHQKLVYHGKAAGLLTLVLLSTLMFLGITALFGGLGFWLISLHLPEFGVIGCLVVAYLLSMAFASSWFIISIYHYALSNTQLQE